MSAACRSPGARSSDPERVRGLLTQRGEASAFRVRNAEGGVQSDVQPFQLCLNTGYLSRRSGEITNHHPPPRETQEKPQLLLKTPAVLLDTFGVDFSLGPLR